MPSPTRATLLTTLAALWLAIAPLASAGAPLPRDPDLVEGVLTCGLRYAIKARTDTEELAVYLAIDVSPIDEAPDEIEASRLLGLLPLGATERFPVDARASLVDAFGAGARVESRVGFDGTWFQMDIPEPDPARLALAINFAADVLSAPSFDKTNIESQRKALLTLRAAATTPRTRAQAALFSGLKMDVDLGRRFLGADKGQILALDASTLKRFHDEWYAPANSVLVIVGDLDAEQTEHYVKKAFAEVKARPTPKRTPFGPLTSDRPPLLIEQSGLHVADADIVLTDAPRPPVKTHEDLQARMVDAIVQDILELRLREAARRRNVDAEVVRAWTFNMGGRFTLRNAFVRGRPEDWASLAGVLADAIASLADAPIADDEFNLARDMRIARERRKLAAGDGADASNNARSLAEELLAGHTPVGWTESAEARIEALLTLDNIAISARAPKIFSAKQSLLALTTTPTDASPAPEALATAFAPAENLDDLRAPVIDADEVLATLPEPTADARIDQIQLHPAGEVLSAWLANGVRLHHRRMDAEPGLVRVSLSITGGRINESRTTHGLTDAATVAFRYPATSSLSAAKLEAALERTTIEMRVRAHEDLVLVQASGARDDLPTLLRLLGALLRDGRIDDDAFDRWHAERLDQLRMERTTPYRAGPWAFAQTCFSDDSVGVHPPSPEQFATIDHQRVQEWLDQLLAGASFEVAIVGDIDRQTALDLAAGHLGALPSSRRVSEARSDDSRTIEFARFPHRRTFNLGPETDQGLVFVGFHTLGRNETEEQLKLDTGAAVFSERIKQTTRDAPEFVEPPYAIAWASDAYDNHGFVVGVGVSSAADVDAAGDRLDKALEWLLVEGPDAAIIEQMTERLATERERALSSSDAWAERLARLDYHAQSIDDFLTAPSRLRELTADDVFVAMRKRARAASIFKVVIKGGDDAPSQGHGKDH